MGHSGWHTLDVRIMEVTPAVCVLQETENIDYLRSYVYLLFVYFMLNLPKHDQIHGFGTLVSPRLALDCDLRWLTVPNGRYAAEQRGVAADRCEVTQK